MSKRAAQLASAAKVGTAALAGVDAVLICQKLSATQQDKKVETAYNEIGGFIGSLAAGVGVGLALTAMATPVGWVAAIIITGTTGYAGKKIGAAIGDYVLQGKGDIAKLENGQILTRWCN